MSDPITVDTAVTGTSWKRCKECGATADMDESVAHEDGCPAEVDA